MIKPTQVSSMKGALVSVQMPVPIPKVIIFQYNPETLKRTVKPGFTGTDKRGPAYFNRAPQEDLSLDIQLDATDELETDSVIAKTLGIRPQLAALELLAYPSLTEVADNLLEESFGIVSGPLKMSTPQVLFTFGPGRVMPVRIDSISVTEEFFDQMLNPIRAKVSLSMTAVSYSDVYSDDPNYWFYVAYQAALNVYSGIYQTTTAARFMSKVASLL